MKITLVRPGVPKTALNVSLISDHPEQLGKKRPVAFVLPGGPGADHTGYLNYACLKDQVDLVFHDPRGCGESDTGELASYTMDNYIEDVEGLRQALSLEKIIVIGKSYGSMCALGYALRYPHVVAKLVLAAGAPSYHFLETAKKNIQRIGSPQQIEVCEKLWTGSFTSRDDLFRYFQLTQTLYSVKARKEATVDLNKKSQRFAFQVLNEGFRHSFWHFNYEKAMLDLQVPTLILAGREDWINDVSHAEWMGKTLPNSALRIFDDASHAMEVDVCEAYFQTIADFIT